MDKPLGAVYERTFDMLNDANMALYPVDVRGLLVQLFPDITQCNTCGRTLTSGMANTPGAPPTPEMNDRSANLTTLQTFADMTGGRAFYNRNDVEKALNEIGKEGNTYYMLGFYVDQGEKPGWRKLKVSANRLGSKVRSRNGYFLSKLLDDPNAVRQMDIIMASNSPLEYTGVPMTVRWGGVSGDGPKKTVRFSMVLPANTAFIDPDTNQMNLDFAAFARDNQGNDAAHVSQSFAGKLRPEGVEQIKNNGITYNNVFSIAPGDYTVRFVIRDNSTGKTGSVVVPLKVS